MLSIEFTPEAEQDAIDTVIWYNKRRTGLGQTFILALDKGLVVVQRNPNQFPIIHQYIRRALLKRFPYAVYFLVEQDAIVVIAIQQTFRDAENWKRRVLK